MFRISSIHYRPVLCRIQSVLKINSLKVVKAEQVFHKFYMRNKNYIVGSDNHDSKINNGCIFT